MTEYKNPSPVAVALIPVRTNDGRRWLLAQRRGDNKGLAFPAGYLEELEDHRQAASRELKEEMHIVVAPETFRPVETATNHRNVNMIFMLSSVELTEEDLKVFQPTAEALELHLVNRDSQLIFPFHQQVLVSDLW